MTFQAPARAARPVAVASVLGAAAIFGTTGTTVELLAPYAPAPSVAAWRLLVGALGLVAFVAWRDGWPSLAALWRRPLVWVMGASIAGNQVCFFLGTTRTGVAVGTLITIGIAPLLAGLIGWVAREGAPGWVWVLSTVVAVAGLVLLSAGSMDRGDGVGMVFAVLAGAGYAVYTVLGVKLSREGHRPRAVLASGFAIGAALTCPAIVGTSWWLTGSGSAAVLWLGLVTVTVAYLLFGAGLRVLLPGAIATLTLLEPVVATLLGVLVLSESIAGIGWIGCALIVLALAVLGLSERRGAA